MAQVTTHEQEIKSGDRFGFGKNWKAFLSKLNQDRIDTARNSLVDFLEYESLEGKRFLDIGCGSGLFSLGAMDLGAEVVSIDFDPYSVGCARTLKEKFYPNSDTWTIKEGSVLDEAFMQSLGKFDIVYSWGVLHHTGSMYEAFANALIPLAEKGDLGISIYNDQGTKSKVWLKIKKIYNSNFLGKVLMVLMVFPFFMTSSFIVDVAAFKNPITRYRKMKIRGMSLMNDWLDWLGGLPFEVAKAEEIFEFYKKRGLQLKKLRTTNSMGNNWLVFTRG